VCSAAVVLVFFGWAHQLSARTGLHNKFKKFKFPSVPVFQVVVVVHFTFHGSTIDLLTTRRDITDTIFHAPAHSIHARKIYKREGPCVFVK
jgi:hypothetical protein